MLSDWTPQACRGQRRVAFTARHPCWPTWRWHIRASWRRDSCSLPVRLTCFNLCAACLKDDLHREIALGTIWMDPILALSPLASPTQPRAHGLLPIFHLLRRSRLNRDCMKDGLWRPKPSKFDNVKSPRRAGARALVSQLDRDTIDEIATLALQSKPVVSSMLDMKQAQSSSPANDDESHKRDELLALAAQWSDVSGDSDIHEDNL